MFFWHGDRKGLGAARHDAELADAGEFVQEKQTAAKGSSDAQLGLALRFVQGQGVDKDLYEAAKWARLAADQQGQSATEPGERSQCGDRRDATSGRRPNICRY